MAEVDGKALAIFCSDIHLTETPPIARSLETDWMEVQGRMLRQVGDIAKEMGCRIFCAGDIFDRWNPSPSLINWAIDNLPYMVAVPGQHDLPLHNYDDLKRSAYWTLVEAKTIENLDGIKRCGCYAVSGYPWGKEIRESNRVILVGGKKMKSVLLTHRYIWTDGFSYPQAQSMDNVQNLPSIIGSYDLAVFGDNHQGFLFNGLDRKVLNCGCLIQRKKDERKLTPCVGVLFENGKVKRIPLDTSKDVWLEEEHINEEENKDANLEDFLQHLSGLDTEVCDFYGVLRSYLDGDGISDGARKLLLEVMEECK